MQFDDETNPYMTGFPQLSPDFQLERIEDETRDNEGSRFWKDKDGFCEVKADSNDGPKAKDPQRQQGDSFAERQLRSTAHVRETVSPFLYRTAHLRLSILRLHNRPSWCQDIPRVRHVVKLGCLRTRCSESNLRT